MADGNFMVNGYDVPDSPGATSDSFNIHGNALAANWLAAGTLIGTPDGWRPIETLARGDLVETADHGPQPLRWVGKMSVPGVGRAAPVRIRGGAMKTTQDLWVSQEHGLLVRGARAQLFFGAEEILVAARHLVNGATIRIVPGGVIDYHHLLFDTHELVRANGCLVESLDPGELALSAIDPRDRAALASLLPMLGRDAPPRLACRPWLKRYEGRLLTM